MLNWNQRVKIAYGAAKGMEFLHEKVQPPIVHRDVRSSNVLLFNDFVAKMADFNLTNASSDTAARLHSTRVLGTFGYHAPEYCTINPLIHIFISSHIITNILNEPNRRELVKKKSICMHF